MKDSKNIKKIAAPPEVIAEMFGIPVAVLNNWRWKGVGPRYYKRRRRITYFIADVISFIKEYPVLTSESLPDEKKGDR